MPGFAMRLALIFAHLEWCSDERGDPPGEVREADMARALDFLRGDAAPMTRRCFGEAALPEAEAGRAKAGPLAAPAKPRSGYRQRPCPALDG